MKSPNRALKRAQIAFSQAVEAGDWSSAVAALDPLIEAAPGNASLHYNRALALRLAGRPTKGLAAAQRAAGLDPSNIKAVFEIGACGLEAGEIEVSLAASETCLASDPDDGDAALNAARAALLLGRPETALAHLRALPGNAIDVAHRLAESEALRDLGRLDEAERLWAELAERSPAEVLSLRTKGARGRIGLSVSHLVPARHDQA